MLHQVLRQAIVIFGFAVPAWLVFRIIFNIYVKRRGREFSLGRECGLFLFFVYIICVLMVTVMPLPMARGMQHGYAHINIVPVVNTSKQFQATVQHGTRPMLIHSLENIVGNIVLFFPLGFGLPLLWPGYWSFKRTLLLAIAFSTAIELTQLASRRFGLYRSVDVDDVLLNTAGAVLGLVLAGMIRRKKVA